MGGIHKALHHGLMYEEEEKEEEKEEEESKKRMVRCHLPTDNLDHFVFTDQHSQRPSDYYILLQYKYTTIHKYTQIQIHIQHPQRLFDNNIQLQYTNY